MNEANTTCVEKYRCFNRLHSATFTLESAHVVAKVSFIRRVLNGQANMPVETNMMTLSLFRKFLCALWLCTGVCMIVATLLRCILSLREIHSINLRTIWSVRETVRNSFPRFPNKRMRWPGFKLFDG